jgi:hypothetical protein
MRSRALPLVSGLFSCWYAAHAWLSHQSTCTMGGGADDFVGGLLIGAPGAVCATVLLALARPVGWAQRVMALLAAGPALLTLLFLVVPWFLGTTVLGHHVCGAEFDDYLAYSAAWERAIPAAHLLLCGCVCMAAAFAFACDWRSGSEKR